MRHLTQSSLVCLLTLLTPSLGHAAPPPHHHHLHHRRLRHHARHTRLAHAAIARAAPTITLLAAAAIPPPPPPPAPTKGSDSGLPIPRFAALRSDDVSFRSGPGTQYPIEWIYQRRYLPVKIEREFEVWRLVAEPDGTRGWVHEAMLTGHRGFLIAGDQPVTLRAAASATAAPVAILEPEVVGRLLRCTPDNWCEVSTHGHRGWLERGQFWGTLPDEAVKP